MSKQFEKLSDIFQQINMYCNSIILNIFNESIFFKYIQLPNQIFYNNDINNIHIIRYNIQVTKIIENFLLTLA